MNIWAHRGESAFYPENTILAFREALKYDITGIELDIQLTKDARMAVIHDETVDRTTDGSGMVKDFTMEELKKLRIDVPEGGEKETVPTIEEVFDLLDEPCKKRGLLINIELKNSKVRYEGMEEMILGLAKERGLLENIVFSSFLPESVELIKKLCPGARTAILAPTASECLLLAKELGADGIHPHIGKLDVRDLSGQTAGPVRAWTAGLESFWPSPPHFEKIDPAEAGEKGVTDFFTNAPHLYAPRIDLCKEDELNRILLFPGFGVSTKNGRIKAEKGCTVNREPVKVYPGTRLVRSRAKALSKVFFYSKETDEKWIRTYSYEPESNWSSYDASRSMPDWSRKDVTFREEGFIRMVFQTEDEEKARASFLLSHPEDALESERSIKSCFMEEIRRCEKRVRALKKPGDSLFFLLADSHYVTNGNWDDTAKNLKLEASLTNPDALIHLGDLTDGLLPKALTKQFSGRVMRDLKAAGAPVFLCVGNHDTNYFRQNKEKMSREECCFWYLGRTRENFVKDMPERKLRLIFLASFDSRKKTPGRRYGFSPLDVLWLKRALVRTPGDYGVIVFSHVPFLAQMHVWSVGIRGGRQVQKVLSDFQNQRHSLIAYIHGHNHADQIYRGLDFPVIALGCSKMECFQEYKPKGSISCDREAGSASQELWDIMRVSADRSEIDLIRFGAGADRHINCRA